MGVYVPPPGCALEECCLCTIAQFRCILNPLESALTRPLASVHYTGLTGKLSPLESALTKNRRGGALGNGPSTIAQSLSTPAGGRNPAEFPPPKAGASGFSRVSDQRELAPQDVRIPPRNACRPEPARETPHSQDIAEHRRAHSTRDHRFPTTGPAPRIFPVRTSPGPANSPSRTRSC